MKKYILYIVILGCVVFNGSCTSDDLDTLPVVEDLATVTVKEYKTNIPLEGVKVSTFFCKEYDFQFGRCTLVIQESTCTTTNSGTCKCKFPKDNFHRITFEKENYWIHYFSENEYEREFSMQPESWVTVDFKTIKEYPSTSHFFIAINGEKGFTSHSLTAAEASSMKLTIFGNEINTVEWALYEVPNTSSQLLNSGNFSLHPKRFENMTYTLIY